MKRIEHTQCNDCNHQRCEESPYPNTSPHNKKWSHYKVENHNWNHSWTVYPPKLWRWRSYIERWALWKFTREVYCQVKCQDNIDGEECHGYVENGPYDALIGKEGRKEVRVRRRADGDDYPCKCLNFIWYSLGPCAFAVHIGFIIARRCWTCSGVGSCNSPVWRHDFFEEISRRWFFRISKAESVELGWSYSLEELSSTTLSLGCYLQLHYTSVVC